MYVSKISFTLVKQTNKNKSHEKVFIPYACFGGHYVFIYELFIRPPFVKLTYTDEETKKQKTETARIEGKTLKLNDIVYTKQ